MDVEHWRGVSFFGGESSIPGGLVALVFWVFFDCGCGLRGFLKVQYIMLNRALRLLVFLSQPPSPISLHSSKEVIMT